MFCSKCGNEVVAGSAFCRGCGAPIGAALDPAVVVKRPGLVTLLAVLQFLSAALLIALGFFGFVFAENDPNTPAGFGMFVGGIWLAFGIVNLFCGIGLWTLKPYGRILQLVLAAIGLLAIPVGTVIGGLTIYYLTRPGMRALFSNKPLVDLSQAELAEIHAATRSSSAVTILIVVLVVLGGIMAIGIIAAIAVPGLLRARMSANEASAIGSMRTINSAQAAYSSAAGSGRYAIQLGTLGRACPGFSQAFITPDLAQDPSLKSGYTIALQSAGAEPGPPDCNGVSTEADYYATAQPVNYNVTGRRAFSTSATGTVYVNDGFPPPLAATLDGTATPVR